MWNMFNFVVEKQTKKQNRQQNKPLDVIKRNSINLPT